MTASKRILVIAGSDSSGGAYAIFLLRVHCQSQLTDRVQWSWSWPKGHRCSRVLCNDCYDRSYSAKHTGRARYPLHTTCVLKEAAWRCLRWCWSRRRQDR